MIYPCWKEIFPLLLHISFTALLIKNFNLYFHKPDGYFLTDHSDSAHSASWKCMEICARLINILSRREKRLFFKKCTFKWRSKEGGRSSAFSLRSCKLVLLPLTAQAGRRTGHLQLTRCERRCVCVLRSCWGFAVGLFQFNVNRVSILTSLRYRC